MALNLLRSSAFRANSVLASRTYFTYSTSISQPLERKTSYVEARKAVECIKSGRLSADNVYLIYSTLPVFCLLLLFA